MGTPKRISLYRAIHAYYRDLHGFIFVVQPCSFSVQSNVLFRRSKVNSGNRDKPPVVVYADIA